MYVCICNAINCRTVRSLVDDGASTVGAVFRAKGCTVRCGRCVSTMRDMIDGHRAANSCDAAPSPDRVGYPVAAE